MKTFLLSVMAVMILISQSAEANCLPMYREKIKALEAKMAGFQTNIATTAISEAALVGTMVLVTGSVAAGSVLVMPATIVGEGSYLGYLKTQSVKYKKASQLIKDSYAGEGKRLSRVVKKINHRLGTRIDKKTMALFIVSANESNLFCEVEPTTEKLRLMGHSKILRYLKEQSRAGHLTTGPLSSL